jgi:FHS family L-fucose permease-like MFS transporter
MFPTIFALATEQLGADTPNGSGLLCVAIVGGALIPPLTGKVADTFGLATAFLVPAVCYLWILAYGIMTAQGLGLTKQQT